MLSLFENPPNKITILQGIYELSPTLNETWISFSKAIWFNSGKNAWLIGGKDNIGEDVAGVYAERLPESGPDDENIKWYYYKNVWKTGFLSRPINLLTGMFDK